MLTKPLIALSALLGYTEAQVAGAYVHNLDDNEHVQRISKTGLTFYQQQLEIFLSVTLDSGSASQGYAWVVDHADCDGIVDITTNIEDYPSTNPNADNAYQEEIFTLTRTGLGTCDFTIAYAILSKFDSEAKKNVISIPIRVVDTKAPERDPNWTLERKDFGVFGWNELIRGIFLFHVLSDLPTAWSFFRVRKGHTSGVGTFKWLAKWYSGIGGWVASLGNLAIAGVLIAKGIDDYNESKVDQYFQNQDCSRGGNDYQGRENCANATSQLVSVWNLGATFIFMYEITTWCIYYIYKTGALKYADSLDDERDEYY